MVLVDYSRLLLQHLLINYEMNSGPFFAENVLGVKPNFSDIATDCQIFNLNFKLIPMEMNQQAMCLSTFFWAFKY